MQINKFIGLLVLLCCELCFTIKVPIIWNESGNSAVKNEQSQVETISPQKVQTLHQSQLIPIEYFQYTAQKPQFAADVAAFHGVKNPQEHYKSYPIEPFTGQTKPVLGIHQMPNQDKTIYQPYQNYVQKHEKRNHIHPVSTGYEIFHPYKAEEPALQAIYKDPTLSKIREDLQDSKDRLQAHEQEEGQAYIGDEEYLEGQQKTDKRLFPQKNIPARYEIHRPERRPIYYNIPPKENLREHVLNQRIKHPWNQQNVKIKPLHYKPLKNHIHHLRQKHAMKYDDERNEYPQVIVADDTAEPQEGQDIYERGKQKYTQLRNNVDTSINKIVQQNRPKIYETLELQKNEPESINEEDDFIPVKNYAQVRKTETVKHVPRKTAFDDAETLEEILNAPRLREAVKSTKAQTVYSEEGYEDSAYDHAGEQKHASDHEQHGGFLKQKESSEGLYKIPTVIGSYQDDGGSEYRDNSEHRENWKNNEKEDDEESEVKDYSEDENEESEEANVYNKKESEGVNRSKREGQSDKNHDNDTTIDITTYKENTQNDIVTKNTTSNIANVEHGVDKRETNFQVPEINIDSTFLTEKEITNLSKLKVLPKSDNIREKYPYYFKNLKQINKNSPLRYAENFKFIPKKSEGGTEFYDSRSTIECPEVEDDVNPLPEKLKNGENPTEEDNEDESINKKEEEFSIAEKQPRLKGLGNKIDCFKVKYFGENPLDNPFFKEEFISNPEIIKIPTLPIYEHLKIKKEPAAANINLNNMDDMTEKVKELTKNDIFALLNKLRTDTNSNLNKSDSEPKTTLITPHSTVALNSTGHSTVTDILLNRTSSLFDNINKSLYLSNSTNDDTNDGQYSIKNTEEVIRLPSKLRYKRSTPFVYEPYKIIKDSQFQDSKKTTTTSNISPLIRQLQSSRVVDRVSRSNRDNKQTKPGVSSRSYVDISRKERDKSNNTPTIVNVNIDQRRGEPRYEIRPSNHKSEYTPVENKKTLSLEDYKSRAVAESTQDSNNEKEQISDQKTRNGQSVRQKTMISPIYDPLPFLPSATSGPHVAESNTITKKSPETISGEIKQIKNESDEDSEVNEEDYDDDEEEEEDEELITTTTSTTPTPAHRQRTTFTTTTEKSEHINNDEPERLRLITRFRNYKPTEKLEEINTVTEPYTVKKYNEDNVSIPKYREKKKKSSKTTLVTDTKKYGDEVDDEDEMRKEEEVDALIGVKHDMDDFMPLYEKEEQEKLLSHKYNANIDEEDDDDDDDDDHDGDDEDDDDDDDEDEEHEDEEEEKLLVTTPEPTKRSLVRTTDAPSSTVASFVRTPATPPPFQIAQPENKPIVTRKKIEIHKELPINKSSPHLTQFKQDIKEEETIKESPMMVTRKPHKKGEVLEFYKDDNLAKDINKLGDVEIFNDNIDLDGAPKHGGNYRKATKEDLKLLKPHHHDIIKVPKDAEASQSENTKHVEFGRYKPHQMHGGNLKSIDDIKRMRNSGRSAKLVELSDRPVRTMHGGNLQYDSKKRGGRRNEKLIEFDDDRDDHPSQDDEYKRSPHNTRTDRLHGGNYRSEKLVAVKEKENDDIKVGNPNRESRRNSALLLNSFVQAVPVLTTTPGYILDPSKRMYYYVDA